MVIVYKLNKKVGVMRRSFALILFIVILIAQISYNISVLDISSERVNNKSKINISYSHFFHAQTPVNDTSEPTIEFIHPILANTLVSQKIYDVIVNITDDNPPLPGNVIIQISNDSAWLFNASMILTTNNQWSFIWNNLSSHENQANYTIRVWALDSSPNANYGWSEEYHIFLSIQESPGIFNIIMYIIFVSIIFALIMVYLNRKVFRKSSRKDREKIKGVLKD